MNGEEVKKILSSRGFSQQQVADLLGKSRANLNGMLGKVLGDGVFPKLSSNWARHTWATLCAELDIPDPTITLGMGHKTAGNKTTAIYIRRDMAKVDEANRRVMDYIMQPRISRRRADALNTKT